MAETDQMNGGIPAPPMPAPPVPPEGALDKGVTGANPMSDPAQSLMAESVRLAGPLGGIAIGAATGAAHHAESANQPPPVDKAAQMVKDPDFLALQPNEKTQLLSQVDPQFKSLVPEEQAHIVSRLIPKQTSDQENVGNILGEQWLSPQAQNTANQQEKGISAAETGAILGGPLAPALAETMGAGVGTSAAIGATQGAVQGTTNAIADYNGANPFLQEMAKAAKQVATATTVGAVGGAALHGAGKLAGNAINRLKGAVLPSGIEEAGDVTEGHFQKVPKEMTPQTFPHGTPVVGDQPLNTTDIAALRQGRTLSTNEANLLKQYVGDTVPSGSTVKNTIYGAVKPVNEAINRLGEQMNEIIQNAKPFAQSTIEDPAIGTPLLEDFQSMRENLPLGPDSDPLNKVFTTQLEANHKALVSTDPQEILAARRKLSNQIDWDNIVKNPETAQEAKNQAQARIYRALSDKLKSIPDTTKPNISTLKSLMPQDVAKAVKTMKDLDAEFQPNLELRSWLDKILPEGLTRDPVEAEAQRVLEHTKGLRKIAIDAHNARVDRNYKIAGAALAAAGVGAAKYGLPGSTPSGSAPSTP